MDTQSVFFSLLRRVLRGGMEDVTVSSNMLPQLFGLADAHDLAHLAGQALSDLGALGEDDISRQFREKALQAVYRYGKQNYELQRICAVLEAAAVPFVPLKGSVIRSLYPEGWMRSSGDIDILVKPSDLERAAAALEKQLGCRLGKKAAYDLTMLTESGVRLELHFDTMEESRADSMRRVLEKLWEHAAPAEPGAFRHVLTDEMFYYYHIAHMVRHFEAGGCGVRPFLDLWLLDCKGKYDPARRETLLREGGLLSFARCAEKLARVWMEGESADETSLLLQRYILQGGVYGSIGNFVAVNQTRAEGKTEFLLSKVFLPYEKMRELYPIVKKSKWLLPVAHVQRWGRHLLGGMDRLKKIFASNAAVTPDQRDAMTVLLERLDLPE